MSYTDDKPVGWTNPHTGETFTHTVGFCCAMDNYEPVPRRIAHSLLEVWTSAEGSVRYVVVGWNAEPDAFKAIYLIDDGCRVTPWYVQGFSQERDRIMLDRFPVNVNDDGSPRLRTDDGRPVDYSTWLHGPVRAYHLKITPVA
jgi:hypothetical protein